MYNYRCASHFDVLDAEHAARFAQRLRTIALALLADNNYGTAISLLEEAKHESPTVDVDADLKRARAAQNKPPVTQARPALVIRHDAPVTTAPGKTSAASSPVTPPSDAEMVMAPPDFQPRCRPKRKTE